MIVEGKAWGSTPPPKRGWVLFRWLVVGLLLAIPLVLGGLALKDHFDQTKAMPALEADWKAVRQALTDRLHQAGPIEVGQVCATPGRQLCGVVNGTGSFGGKTGMVRFYAVDRQPVLKFDTGIAAFEEAFEPCMKDHWLVVKEGSQETGFCATKEGDKVCNRIRF